MLLHTISVWIILHIEENTDQNWVNAFSLMQFIWEGRNTVRCFTTFLVYLCLRNINFDILAVLMLFSGCCIDIHPFKRGICCSLDNKLLNSWVQIFFTFLSCTNSQEFVPVNFEEIEEITSFIGQIICEALNQYLAWWQQKLSNCSLKLLLLYWETCLP